MGVAGVFGFDFLPSPNLAEAHEFGGVHCAAISVVFFVFRYSAVQGAFPHLCSFVPRCVGVYGATGECPRVSGSSQDECDFGGVGRGGVPQS